MIQMEYKKVVALKALWKLLRYTSNGNVTLRFKVTPTPNQPEKPWNLYDVTWWDEDLW